MKHHVRHMKHPGAWRKGRRRLLILAFLLFFGLSVSGAPGEEDSCTGCHGDPNFQITNRNLARYYKQWSKSIHGLEEVGCAECHGGNPRAKGKRAAHRKMVMGVEKKNSPVYYRNIPFTCAKCHEEIFDQFKKSTHYTGGRRAKGTPVVPNCVTCHGSVNTSILTVNTVRVACEKCHNKKNELSPEVPERAENIMAYLNNIRRYFNYISLKIKDGKIDQDELWKLRQQVADLTLYWHAIDLDQMESATRKMLDSVKVIYKKIN